MSRPTVYILMPVYNSEEFLRKSLSSIDEQTYKNIKCIIYNDSSTDLGKDIIEEYLEQDPDSFVLINGHLHSGIEMARSELQNYVINSSRAGDYVLSLDSDDRIKSPDFVSSFVNRMTGTGADICLWGFDIIYGDESQKENSFITVKEQMLSKKIIDFICSKPSGSCSTEEIIDLHLFTSLGWTKGYKSELFNALPKPKISGDAKFDDFVYMAGLFGAKKITALSWDMYRYEYLKRSSSATGERKPKDLNDVVDNLEMFWEHSVKNSVCREFIKLKINDYESLGTMLVEKGKFKKEHVLTYKTAAKRLLLKIS